MPIAGFFTPLLVIFVCAQPIFWLVALRRYKRYMNIRLRRIEEKLNLICDCLSIEASPNESLEMVRDLVQADLKSEAIEVFCQQTGADLMEAQRAIQAIDKGQL